MSAREAIRICPIPFCEHVIAPCVATPVYAELSVPIDKTEVGKAASRYVVPKNGLWKRIRAVLGGIFHPRARKQRTVVGWIPYRNKVEVFCSFKFCLLYILWYMTEKASKRVNSLCGFHILLACHSNIHSSVIYFNWVPCICRLYWDHIRRGQSACPSTCLSLTLCWSGVKFSRWPNFLGTSPCCLSWCNSG